jgi:glycosyltransferase involved in cell wall biosynthesis
MSGRPDTGGGGTSPPARVCVFGTFDSGRHPRVEVLERGLSAAGFDVVRVNHPWSATTAERVRAMRDPLLAVRLLGRLFRAWRRLAGDARRIGPVDVVVVGYLGVFDVHLARRLWPRARIVLDDLAPVGATVADRSGGRLVGWLASLFDRWATRTADLVVVDTEEHAAIVGSPTPTIVVPVGAPTDWFVDRASEDGTRRLPGTDPPVDGALSLVFFGLHTPLQGTPVIAEALRRLLDDGVPLAATLVGTGQDLPACRDLLGDRRAITWHDWIPPADLPSLVAAHDVCLGIFGDTPKV